MENCKGPFHALGDLAVVKAKNNSLSKAELRNLWPNSFNVANEGTHPPITVQDFHLGIYLNLG